MLEGLIHHIVHVLRRSRGENLLQTTAIWILSSILRLEGGDDANFQKNIMVAAGIPGVVHDILLENKMSGSTREYASELCFYLCSETPYPLKSQIPRTGPLKTFPEIHTVDKLSVEYDMLSNASSDISSSILVRHPSKKDTSSFVPYRIDNSNLQKMNDIFDATCSPKYDINEYSINAIGSSQCLQQTRNVFTRNGSLGSHLDQSFDSYSEFSSNYDEDTSKRMNTYPNTSSISYKLQALDGAGIGFDSMSTVSTGESTMARIQLGLAENKMFARELRPDFVYAHKDEIKKQSSDSRMENSRLFKINSDADNQSLASVRLKDMEKTRNLLYSTRDVSSSSALKRKANFYDGDSLSRSNSSPLTKVEPQRASTAHLPSHSYHYSPLKSTSLYKSTNSLASWVSDSPSRGPIGIETSSDVPGAFAELDPLSLNVSAGFNAFEQSKRKHPGTAFSIGRMPSIRGDNSHDNGSLEDTLNIVEEDSEDSEDNFDDDNEEKELEKLFAGMEENPFLAKKRMRIRAEKLVDFSFVRSLFQKSISVLEAQSFIHRLEDLFLLMDEKNSGYITWEGFGRIILAVAPQHILRADVVQFIESQGHDMDNLFDYREFVMSGKVLVIQKRSEKSALPISGWLQRQKTFANDSSTYTWKNHVKWFRKSKAKAVVWLMRRAKRAMKQASVYEDAKRFLLLQAIHAKALTYLMEAGRCALASENDRIDAKRHLLRRVLHARRWKIKREEAEIFLQCSGKLAIDDEELLQEHRDKNQDAKVTRLDRPPKVKQADVAKVYVTYYHKQQAFFFLRKTGYIALEYLNYRMGVLKDLVTFSRRIVEHSIIQDDCQKSLVALAERSRDYCSHKDDILKGLLRIGRNAFKFFLKQEYSMGYLINKGKASLNHVNHQENTLSYLCQKGQWYLWYMNRREDAFGFLISRSRGAIALLKKKEQAFLFFRSIVEKYWKQENKRNAAFAMLSKRGKRALNHTNEQLRCRRLLQYYGGRAATVKKRLNMAFVDLLQVAQYSKFYSFMTKGATNKDFTKRVDDEKTRIARSDARTAQNRKGYDREQKLRAVFEDAFYWSSILYNKITLDEAIEISAEEDNNPDRPVVRKNCFHPGITIGRYAFKRILLDGKLLDLPEQSMDAQFDAIDCRTEGFIKFKDFWEWFVLHWHEYEANVTKNSRGMITSGPRDKKKLFITLDDIFSSQDRAIITIMRRFAENEARQFLEAQEELAATNRRRTRSDSDFEEEEAKEEVVFGDDFGTDEFGMLMAKMRIRPPPKTTPF